MENKASNNSYLIRTLNEKQWGIGEEEFEKTGQSVLVEKSYDGFEFWIVEHNSEVKRKTVYGNDVYYNSSRAKQFKCS